MKELVDATARDGPGQGSSMERCEKRGMLAHNGTVPSIRRHGQDDHRTAHRPSAALPDGAGESCLDVETAEQVLQVQEERLHLDDHEDAGSGVRRQEVDPTALAPLPEPAL